MKLLGGSDLGEDYFLNTILKERGWGCLFEGKGDTFFEIIRKSKLRSCSYSEKLFQSY